LNRARFLALYLSLEIIQTRQVSQDHVLAGRFAIRHGAKKSILEWPFL
jgi:hypothetical protein